MELERPAEAKKYLEQAVASNGENAISRYLPARVYRRAGDDEGRREQLRVYRRLQAESRDLDQSILSGGRPEPAAQQLKSEGP